MLAVRPAKASPTTATTPTPIGCKLLKINRLALQLSLRCRFERCAFYRTYRPRQLLFSTLSFESQITANSLLPTAYFLESRLALRFEEVRILQSKSAPSTTFAELFLNNCDAGEFALANLRHHSRAHRYRDAFIR